MHNVYFYVIVGILVLDFLLERWLEYLNTRAWSPELPEVLRGIYDPAKYRLSQEYYLANLRFGVVSSVFSFLLIMAMIFSGGFARVDQLVRQAGGNEIVTALLFFGVLGLAYDLLTLPFQWYDTFVIEERFGFNKTTRRTFVLDKLKGWLLTALLGGLLLAAMVWFYQVTGRSFWIWAWVLFALFTLFLTMFYSTLIVPLFNKQTPLEEGELKTAILDFTEKTGFKLDNVYVIDGSKRSTKANAYFSGLGPKKRVVLYDTLINDLETEEIVAVLSHEIGHYKKKHVVKGLVMSLVQSALMIWLLWVALDSPALSLALGAKQPSFYMGLLAFGLLLSPVSFFTGIISNILSRKFEFQADAYARKYYSGEKLIKALVKLSVNNLSNLMPHPAYVFFHYSHPPLLRRMKALRD